MADVEPTADLAVTHHTALVNGIRLHFATAGSGAPVVLLHGWPQTWYEWRRVMPALAARYTVIAPDLRGLGDSSKPETGYDLRTLSGDIRRFVEHLGLLFEPPVSQKLPHQFAVDLSHLRSILGLWRRGRRFLGRAHFFLALSMSSAMASTASR